MVDFSTAPNNLGGVLKRYYEQRTAPGNFIKAVLSNDLVTACQAADRDNRYIIFDIVRWIYNEMPGQTWGSTEIVNKWLVKEFKDA